MPATLVETSMRVRESTISVGNCRFSPLQDDDLELVNGEGNSLTSVDALA